jgi:hypothetical protein
MRWFCNLEHKDKMIVVGCAAFLLIALGVVGGMTGCFCPH